jgi:hypothetical protein
VFGTETVTFGPGVVTLGLEGESAAVEAGNLPEALPAAEFKVRVGPGTGKVIAFSPKNIYQYNSSTYGRAVSVPIGVKPLIQP